MSLNRRRNQANRTIRRTHRLLNLTRLEDRLTPAISIMGPHSAAELLSLTQTAGNAWSALAEQPKKGPDRTVNIVAANSWYFQLNSTVLGQKLDGAPGESTQSKGVDYVVSLPRPDGSFQQFQVWEVSIMEPGLAAQFPNIRTYRGQGIDDPYAVLAADSTPAGFHAQVLSPNGAYYIDPYFRLETQNYISYYKRDNVTPHAFVCTVGAGSDELDGVSDGCNCGCGCPLCQASAAYVQQEAEAHKELEHQKEQPSSSSGNTPVFTTHLSSNGATLRTYRTAVAATGEYTAFHGGTQAAGQAAIVTAINRVGGVYEQQLSVRLVLVANNINLVYTNSGTDPYTNNNGSAMLAENQTTIDSVIGSANYDIGHVFSTGGGGVAGLGVVGVSGNKARGVTGSSSPVGDPFTIDYVAHEMGHQFGANHTFNSSTGSCGGGNRSAANAYEQGSGSTIMAYAGICGTDDLQPNSDPYFHWRSLDAISSYISSGAGVGNTQTATGNNFPVVNPGSDYTIPAQTPFALTGSATDADGDSLTYLWEQADLGASTTVSAADNGSSPIFRSWNPTTSPTRTFPRLSNLLANTMPTGEVMPSTNRTLNFKLTVFDNKVDGAFVTQSMKVTVVNTSSAFTVTSPNTAVSYQGNSTQTVTWNVAGTNASGINAANVDIRLSTDGGLTFPTLIATVPNSGTANVQIPNTPTSSARIKIQGNGNIFFDVSNTNFTITAGSSMQVSSTTPANGGLLTGPTADIDFNFSNAVKASTVGTSDISVSQGTVTNAQVISAQVVRYTVSGLNTEGTLNVNMAGGAVTDTSDVAVGSYAASYGVDLVTSAFTTPLTPVNPRGSLSFNGSTTGTINVGGDGDAFTINLDAGQVLSATLAPAAGLQPNLNLTGPGGTNLTVNGSAAGKTALLQSAPITVAGVYTFTVSGLASTTGSYTLQANLNAHVEAEGNGGTSNDTTGTAAAMTGFYDLGGGATVATVRGRTDLSGGALSTETEGNDNIASANDASYDFSAVSSQLYGMTINGNLSTTTDIDYFNIGPMEVGDVITVSMSGIDQGRGTHTDPLLRLYRNGVSGNLIENDDRNATVALLYYDSLIYRYTVTVADTYFIRGYRAQSVTGTYQMGVQLENTSTAPSTGTGVFTETEANETKATANNAAAVWKRVNYTSQVSGSIASTSDVDYYKYTLAAGDNLAVNLTSSSGGDLSVAFYNAAGTLLFDDKGSTDAFGNNSAMFGYNIATAGAYYVRVSSVNSTTGTYSMTTSLSTSVAPPTPTAGTDVFSFPVTAGQPLSLGIEGLTAGVLDVALLDAGGAVMATGAAGPTNFDKALSFTPASTGTWFARITGDGNVDFQLVLNRGAAQDTEANDSFATAQALTNNRAVGAVSGNDDWYQIALTAGQVISLSTTTPGGGAGEFVNSFDPVVELYDPSNALVGSDDNSGGDGKNAALSKAAAATGNYRVRVTGAGGSSGEYTLAASIALAAPPTISGTPIVDDGTAQRSRVRSVTLTFDQVVNLPSNALQLARTGPSGPTGNVTLAVDTSASTPTQTIAKLTFPDATFAEGTSLIDGLYTLTAFSAQVTNGFGIGLDGDGNGSVGPDYTFDLHRLFGDSNGDRAIANNDFNLFKVSFGGSDFTFDFDNDGAVAGSDFNQFKVRFGSSI